MFMVTFNTRTAIADAPGTRSNWEHQLIHDFLVAINGKVYSCEDYNALMARMNFIANRNSSNSSNFTGSENFVEIGEGRDYGVRTKPVAIYGIAQGYVNFEKRLAPLLTETSHEVNIPFEAFYDMRQNSKQFKGCMLEVRKVA